jgi:hypothetical protein
LVVRVDYRWKPDNLQFNVHGNQIDDCLKLNILFFGDKIAIFQIKMKRIAWFFHGLSLILKCKIKLSSCHVEHLIMNLIKATTS